MAVKAKFYVGNVAVTSIGEDREPKTGTVSMYPVCRGAVNKRWAQASPGGRFELTINSSAMSWFYGRIGKEISITMEDATSDPATHEYEPLEEEYQGSYPETTCASCGHTQEAHTQSQ